MNRTNESADSDSTVISLAADKLRSVPEFSSAIGSVADRMLILLDIEKLVRNPAMGLVTADAH